jgi:hypothetical protein
MGPKVRPNEVLFNARDFLFDPFVHSRFNLPPQVPCLHKIQAGTPTPLLSKGHYDYGFVFNWL